LKILKTFLSRPRPRPRLHCLSLRCLETKTLVSRTTSLWQCSEAGSLTRSTSGAFDTYYESTPLLVSPTMKFAAVLLSCLSLR